MWASFSRRLLGPLSRSGQRREYARGLDSSAERVGSVLPSQLASGNVDCGAPGRAGGNLRGETRSERPAGRECQATVNDTT